ncbi:hypothetical protein XA39_11760 [Acinetobacter tandoii]|uniref:hypothetical protein n=1 Tax=Acinetobacter tandoii TaxID=202954 RepID=UPI000C209FF7|nr:hypothetical protein [Acinetobacter tandoii]PJG42578.1 hypothetical protein XA39_11760 [Acinetobacter tandoii]
MVGFNLHVPSSLKKLRTKSLFLYSFKRLNIIKIIIFHIDKKWKAIRYHAITKNDDPHFCIKKTRSKAGFSQIKLD